MKRIIAGIQALGDIIKRQWDKSIEELKNNYQRWADGPWWLKLMDALIVFLMCFKLPLLVVGFAAATLCNTETTQSAVLTMAIWLAIFEILSLFAIELAGIFAMLSVAQFTRMWWRNARERYQAA